MCHLRMLYNQAFTKRRISSDLIINAPPFFLLLKIKLQRKFVMAESFYKIVKISTSLENAFQICSKVCLGSKMKIKESNLTERDFYLKASESINWFSTSWPVKIEIKATIADDKVVLEISSSSSLGSLTQGNANSHKLDNIVQSIITLAE